MGANTPFLNLYLPSGGSSGDPAGDEDYDVDNDNNNMRAIDTWAEGVAGDWQDWVPALSTSNSDYAHTGGTAVGRYQKIGKLILFQAAITTGTVTNSGSGNYHLSFPVAPSVANLLFVGQAWVAMTGKTLADAQSINGYPIRRDGVVVVTPLTTFWSNGTPTGALGNANIMYQGHYEAAS